MSELARRETGNRPDGNSDDPVLSVVVVTHNEEERIESCLSTVFEACQAVPSFEVVLVDSRSTDETIELATQYPVTIYRLPASVEATPSTGRYVGTQLTTGDRILFVDGDMILEPSWLADAYERLEADPSIAGVDGQLNSSDATTAEEVTSLRGVALYDREALTEVGGFDPYLSALEDIELGYRFNVSDYRLVRTPTVAANHPFVRGLGEQLRRWRRGYYFGLGEVLRKSLDSPPILLKALYWSRQYVVGGLWLVCGVASLALGIAGLGVWMALTALGILALLAVRGPTRTLHKFVSFVPVYLGAFIGFRGEHPSPESFPIADVETVHRSNVVARTGSRETP